MTNNHPLPETANDNRIIPPRVRNVDQFDFTLNDDTPLSWNNPDFTRAYEDIPDWHRRQIEAPVPKPPVTPRDKPDVEILSAVPKGLLRWEPSIFRAATIQPHHKMSETIERSNIICVDAALDDPLDWRLLYHLLPSTPVIMHKPGNILRSIQQALQCCLNRQVCILVNLEGADRYWADRLKRFERISAGDSI